MIKTIIFDFGDVLVRDTTKVLEKKYNFDGLPKNKQQAYIKAFHDSEIGKISTQQLLLVMHQTLVPHLSPKEIEQHIVKTVALPVWNLAQKLSKKYKIIIFSNNQKQWPRQIAEYTGQNFFQFPWVNSSFIGMRKPHMESYKYLLAKFKLTATECLFVDDKEKNIIPARKLGIQTFQYQNKIGELKHFLRLTGVQ